MERNPFGLVAHSREKFGYMAEFDIQRWYDAVSGGGGGGETMRSSFVRLTVDQARALAEEHDRRVRLGGDDDDGADQRSDLIKQLEQQLEHVIATDFDGGAVFVRLSTQSPKDVGRSWTEHPRVGQIVREELAATESAGRTLNDRIRALFAASLRVMKVESGRHALDLLLRSERIQSSVLHALANAPREGEDSHSAPWDLCIVVRAWEDEMRLDREFRTFVVRDRLVAISQYNEYCHYPAWADKHQLIASKIHDFFSGLKAKVPREYRDWAYVADFALLGEPDAEEELRVQLVEINPFGPATGASLFDWRTERHLLQAGLDLWGDLDSAATSSAGSADIDAWTKTVACPVGAGEDEQAIIVRLATRPNPEIDASFLTSFGIDILVPTLDDDEDEDDEDDDEVEEDEEEDENQEAIDEFLDEFVVEAKLKPVVREHCGGRFAKRCTPEFVAGAVTSVIADFEAQVWLQERGLSWAGAVEKAVARAAKQWYAYRIATSS